MNKSHLKCIASWAIALFVFIPFLACASPADSANAEGAPPVGSTLVREGAFAISLADALGLGAGLDEIAAESRLGELGISPRNGWIADYPMTPDIVGELQQSLIDAADNSRLPMGRDEALETFYDVGMELGLSVVPYADDSIRQSSSEAYPAPATVNNYYYNYGPPVVTYYAPPPGYVYLYAWVPFPFWSWGFWFPGFYVLHDFHKTVVIDRRVVCVSNHYRDAAHQRVYIVDPVKRFHHSGTVYGIGVPHHRTVVYKSSPRVARQALDISRDRIMRAHAGGNLKSDRNTPAVRPAGRSNENNRPPLTRTVNAPAPESKERKGPGQPARIESGRTVQTGKTIPARKDKTARKDGQKDGQKDGRKDGQKDSQKDRLTDSRTDKQKDGQKGRIDRQARPMLKSIESRPARLDRGPAQVEKRNSRPQAAHTNAGQASRPQAVNQAAPPRDNRTPARIQQKNETGSGQGPGRANQVRQGRAQGNPPAGASGGARSNARSNDRKEAPPQMKGAERGGRG